MTAPAGQWHIEVRTFRIPAGPNNFAHSYLAIVDPSGTVRYEIHGHPSNGGPPTRRSSIEGDPVRLLSGTVPLRVFIYKIPDPNNLPPGETDITGSTVFGPEGRSFPPIWAGTEAEMWQMMSGIRAVQREIDSAQLTYELPGFSAGDARNSNAVFRTMVDFIRDYSSARHIGEFGLPQSVIDGYWRNLQQLDSVTGQRDERADRIRESEATGIPLELLDDTIQNDNGYAALASGIHRNLIKIDPATGLPPDTIEDSSVYPPVLDRFMNLAPAFPPNRSQQAPRMAPGRPDQKAQSPQQTEMPHAPFGEASGVGSGDRSSKKRQATSPAMSVLDDAATNSAAFNGSPGPFHAMLAREDKPDAADLLTVPGAAMSAAQREALMQMPAFSDEGDPLFGPAVWKYRDANAAGAARAVETGAVDGFGRPLKPVFAETDGVPADAAGKPMAAALGRVGQAVDKAAATAGPVPASGPVPAVKALQGAVNDLSDAQVKADTPRDGLQARPRIPKLAVDGDLGPKTREALRLALHQAGPTRLEARLGARLG